MQKIHKIPLHDQKKALLRAAQILKQVIAKVPARENRTKPNETADYLREHSEYLLRALEAALVTIDGLDNGKDMRENL